MGTECVRAHVKEEKVCPSVPPGFTSLTSFILKKMDDSEAMMRCMTSTGVSESHDMDTECDIGDHVKVTRSLRRRPWINYSQFDNSSEESDSEQPDQHLSSITHLPKGVVRGCLEFKNCQKVIARWHTEDACRPVLEEAPVFYPTEEEFKDTLKYIASIRPTAEPFGICRIVPPSSWNPPCPLKEKNIWESSKFSTRIQRVDKLQNRDSMRKMSRIYSKMKRKRRRCLEMGLECEVNGNIMGPNELLHYNEAERFGFEPGPEFSLEAFQKYADDFKGQYFREETVVDSGGNQSVLQKQWEPAVENIEGEYWRMVEKPTDEIEVLYGADLETGVFGSGFPKASSSMQHSKYDEKYLKSGWNLNNFPRLPGSVLSFESGDISGVLVPWLYIGMCFSSFCWHVEDHHFYSLNYLHWGAPKIWYGVPGGDALKLEVAMKKHMPDLFEEQPDLLHKLVTQISPSILISKGVPVYRCVQNPREFVLTFPRAYHSGFNCGFNCAEAVNVAPLDWLPHGQNAVELYREQRRKTSVSHDKLLLGAAREAVRAHWELLLLRKNTLDNLRWKDVCGKDGILAKALKTRVEMEDVRRKYLCISSQSVKMDVSFDASCERECAICFYDLHLSAVGCQCSPERFVCLNHANQLCSCAWSAKSFLFRYEISELNILVDALGGKLSAIYRWAKLDLGLALSSYVSKDSLQVPATISKQSHSSEAGKEKEKDSLDVVASTSTNGIPPKLYQESKAPAAQVTSLSHLIGKPCHSSGVKQKEHGFVDAVTSTSNAWSPTTRLYQKIKAPMVQVPSLNERKEKELITPNMVNSTHSVGDISSLSKDRPPEVVLASKKNKNDLCVPIRYSLEKEIEDRRFQVRVEGCQVSHSNVLSTPICPLSEEDRSYSEIPHGTFSKKNSLGCTTTVCRGNPLGSSVANEPKSNKSITSADNNIILLSDDEAEEPHRLFSNEATGKSSANYLEISARLANCIDKVSQCNYQKDQVLDTPETNASAMSEGDINLMANAEKEDHPMQPRCAKVEDRETRNKCIEYNFMVPSDTIVVGSVPENISCNVGSAGTGSEKTTLDLLSTRKLGEHNIINATSSFQHPHLDGSGKPDSEGKDENIGLYSNSNLTDKARPLTGSPLCAPNNLDRYYRQKGPRIAKVVRRINCNVEPLEFGVVFSGKLWSSSKAIFPKGFKSRVTYLSVLDPTKMCHYVSEILDAGLTGPLFMVMVEQCPSEIFIHISATKCWDMVRERVNQEIRKQHAFGRMTLPPLQPPGSLDGLEMFGFTSPDIIQGIEALDQNRVCSEYWKSMPQTQNPHPSLVGNFAEDHTERIKEEPNDQKANASTPNSPLPIGVDIVLKGLFKKANPEELHSLYNLLSDHRPATYQGLVTRLLNEEIQNCRR